MTVIDKGNVVTGECSACGYRFSDKKGIDIIKLVKEYGSFLAVISLVLVFITFATVGSGVGDMDGRIRTLDGKVTNNFNIC